MNTSPKFSFLCIISQFLTKKLTYGEMTLGQRQMQMQKKMGQAFLLLPIIFGNEFGEVY